MSVTGMEYPSTLPGSSIDSLFTILKLSVYVCMYCMLVANMVKWEYPYAPKIPLSKNFAMYI